jgi:putative ABC transport system permease protein
MLKNYFKLLFRNIQRHKGYYFINIAGLAFGIACCFLIFSWIRYELSFDHFHNNAQEICRVITEFHSPGGEINYTYTNQAPLADLLENRYPEIINSARATNFIFGVGKQGSMSEEEVLCVDPSFLEIFTFPFIQGDPATALTNPQSIILTETLAGKHFQNENPMGKTIIVGQRTPFIVSGIIKDIPDNSHLVDIDAIIPMSFTTKLGWYNLNEWTGFNFLTYIQLQKGVFYKDVERKITDILRDIFPETTTKIQLQPLTRIHLYTPGGGGLIKYIYIFSGMAIFTLLIACINYMNLSTAQASGRAKEVAMRKIICASRRQLICQFLGESLFLSLVATAMAIVLAYSLIPIFRRLTGREIELVYSFWTFLFIVGMFGLTGILSGSYPAFIISAIKPINLINGIFPSREESSFFRKILVIFQFAVSIFLIVITFVIKQQLHLIRNKDLGYNKENIICLSSISDIAQKYITVKNELLTNPNVLGITIVDSFLDSPNSSATSDVIRWEGQTADESIPWLIVKGVDPDFQKTFGIEMSEGRFFSEEFSSDLTEGMVVNEAAVKAMNMDSPIGKWFHFWDFDGTIIGVTKDFHFKSLHKQIEPMVMKMGINPQRIAIRIKPDNILATTGFIEKEIKKIVPNYIFQFEFLDQKLNHLYSAEQRMKNITQAISFLAIFISCLGIFALALYTAERRTKEIGIRKVLGASIPGIFALLTRGFTKWVIVANIIAWPIAYYFMNNWLQNFAYKTSLSWWIFALTGLLALGIALLTVSWQSWRAATRNPVEALRYE